MSVAVLQNFQPEKDFFIGIDSDGCVFDSMEIKHKECFIPNTIKYWSLQPVSKFAREAAEFVNLYSRWRGLNRWPALVKVFDLLRERREVTERKASIPQAEALRDFIRSGAQLSDKGLIEYAAAHPDPNLETALAWTNGVNQSVAEIVHGIPAFPFTHKSLQTVWTHADLMVVSATPTEALEREWEQIGLARFMRLIAGQELGTKQDHLRLAAQGKYAPDHILMIGDAPGDLKAARSINALFYPIVPGHEEESWERLYCEAHQKFLNEEYAGAYEAAWIVEFEKMLPDTPPW
ncbi:MAG TPA: HAD family hydrolase [Anaerolineales bacterium]|nr:HAD family hydrolase [Anaerolineales bacterium]